MNAATQRASSDLQDVEGNVSMELLKELHSWNAQNIRIGNSGNSL